MSRTIVLVLAVVFCESVAYPRQQYVRKNAYSAAAKADLDAMRKAFGIMRSLPCTNPLSWYYQGGIHHIPDTINGKNVYCPQYQNVSQLMPGWATCPHMKDGYADIHFLTWHRLYVYYLEKIVRKLSGKKDFAVPYWDYFDPATRTMPEAFRIPADSSKNSLYEKGRSLTLLKGVPIDDQSSDVVVTSTKVCRTVNNKTTCVDTVIAMCGVPMGVALNLDYLWETTSIYHFSSEMEDAVHNVMHDYIGGAVDSIDAATPIYNRIYQKTTNTLQGLMADVPSAAFDPIFWLHHSNLDRVWMAWEYDHPQYRMTWEQFQKAGNWTYFFFDENGTKVVYTSMEQVYDSVRAINYTYDDMPPEEKIASLMAVAPVAPAAEKVIGTLKPNVALQGYFHQFSVNLNTPINVGPTSKATYSMEMQISFAGTSETKLVISLYDNDLKTICDSDRKTIVSLTGFFGAGPHTQVVMQGNTGHDHAAASAYAQTVVTLPYDITDELKASVIDNPKLLRVSVWQNPPNPSNPITVKQIIIKENTRK